MATALYSHNACLGHENHPGHPECPERLKAILAELAKPEFESLIRREAPQASPDAIARVHDSAYIDTILSRVPKSGYAALDADTGLSPLSGEAALRAAGAIIAAVDDVMKGEIENAFCAVRPPGHHAEHAAVMGFCLFNNVAIGAAHAIAKHGLRRIAIVDFDVHHGNGTEEWAKGQKEILFFSSHQFPLWPGSGLASDRGPLGNIVNVPLPPESEGSRFRRAMQQDVLPKLDTFVPEMIFISAGFDAHRADPLANLALTEDDFGWITGELRRLAKKHAGGRLISTLEGGYNLDALAKSAAAHVRALQKA
jgi:acetoin utilization deacetylase AcuC-like enzyme